MKKYMMPVLFPVAVFALLMAFAQMANAEGQIVDPTITPTATITCVYPVERADNTALALNEIAQVKFFVSQDKTGWQPAGTNNAECKQVYDLAAIPDGQYYYTVMAIDTEGRQSIYGVDATPSEYVAWVVKRVLPPKNPTGMAVTFN